MKRVLVAIVFVLLATVPARAQRAGGGDYPFVDSFEHGRLSTATNTENPLYSAFGYDATNGSPSLVTSPVASGRFALKIDQYQTSQPYLKRAVPSIGSLITHVAINVQTLEESWASVPFFGHGTGSAKSCYVTLGESQANGSGVTTELTASLYFKSDSYFCDAGSANVYTPCTPDAEDRDTTKCAEHAEGEARCLRAPIAVAPFPVSEPHNLSIDETQSAGSGTVTCKLNFDGRQVSERTTKIGTCSKDGWACGTNADCQPTLSGTRWTGVTNGRCMAGGVAKIQFIGYPLDETEAIAGRCRTSQGNGDCTSQMCTDAGGCTCDAQTCSNSTVAAVTEAYLGFPDAGGSGSYDEHNTYVVDDWGSDATKTGLQSIRTQTFYATTNGPTQQWSHIYGPRSSDPDAVADWNYSPYTPDDGTSYLDGDRNTKITEDVEFNAPVSLSTGTCTSNACVGGQRASDYCTQNADCSESVTSSARLSILAVAFDEAEGICNATDDQGYDKSLTLSAYKASTNSNVTTGDETNIGDNKCNDYNPDAEATFTNAPEGGGWTVAKLNDVGVRMTTSRGVINDHDHIRVTSLVGTVDIAKAADQCAAKLTDINGDGVKTVCFNGDSTNAETSFQQLLAYYVCEPDNLIEEATGAMRVGDVAYNISAIYDGKDAGNDFGVTALRGSTCDTAPPNGCYGCDVTLVNIGVNSNLNPYKTKGRYGYCVSPGRAEHAGRCDCASSPTQRSFAYGWTVGAGYCAKAPVGQVGAEKSFCTTGTQCSTATRSFYAIKDGIDTRGVCSGSTCSGSKYCSGGGTSGSCSVQPYPQLCPCSANGECNSNSCVDNWASYSETCTSNADCEIPGTSYCIVGCKDVPGCTQGVCASSWGPMASMLSDFQSMISAAYARNHDATDPDGAGPKTAQSNDTILILSMEPPCGGGWNNPGTDGVGYGMRDMDSLNSRLKRMAIANNVPWVDTRYYFRTQCGGGDYLQCKRDTCHYNALGDETNAVAYAACLRNTDGSSLANFYDCPLTQARP